jgi:MFS transporter, PAT family, beta-lactamase induction signal transducer AmpG
MASVALRTAIVKSKNSLLDIFASRKMAAILLLGFASGLPYALADDAFRAWMTKSGFDLKQIGWLSLVSLPYSLKFLWSPLIDRFRLPLLGRRRGWILVTQVALVGVIFLLAAQMATMVGMNATAKASALNTVAIVAVFMAFLSATQDIAVDAYRTDVLKPLEVGAGASVLVLGYRIALLLTGWLAFNLADKVGWASVYGMMGLFLGVGVLGTFIGPNPPPENEMEPPTLLDAVVQPFMEFFRRLGWQKAVLALVFIILFRLGDAMVAKMAIPFLGAKGLGFSDGDIGNIRQGMGLIATIVGTLSGGAALSKLGINRSLWIFGALQAVSNLGYWILASVGKDYTTLVLAINVENFCSGLGTAGFVGFLMSLCNPKFSATQFALLSSLMAVGRDVIAGPSAGEFAQRLVFGANAGLVGWGNFFLLTLVAALPGILLLPFFAPWNEES